jgi:phage gpG-like protein
MIKAVVGGMRRAFTKKGAFTARFRREERGGKILIQDRRLLRSIKYKVYPEAVEIGSNLVYAARHQFGYKGGSGRGRSTTPARPYLVVLPEDELEIAHILETHIAEPLQ